jgi:hypothetical protein
VDFISLSGTNVVCSRDALVGKYNITVTSSVNRLIGETVSSSTFELEVIKQEL